MVSMVGGSMGGGVGGEGRNSVMLDLPVNSSSANTVRQWTFVFAGILNIAISCLNILSPA